MRFIPACCDEQWTARPGRWHRAVVEGCGGGTRVQCRVTRRSLLGYFGGLFEALSRMSKSANELSVVPVHGRDLRSDVLCGAILI